MTDPFDAALTVAAGADAAGFTQGVTGFAFSAVALSFWAWALPPETAAPLAVFGALTGQIASLASVRSGFEWPKIIPLIVGGWVGVPAGVYLLRNADPQNFRLTVGGLLTFYSLFALLVRDPGNGQARRRAAWTPCSAGSEGCSAVSAGCRACCPPSRPSCAAGDATSHERRCRPTISPMHVVTIAVYAASGTLAHADLRQFLLVAPAMLIPSYLGAHVFTRFTTESAFTRAVLVALLASGIAPVYGALRAWTK